MEASQRKKHAPLNSYVSLDEEPDNDGQIPLTEVLQSLTNGNPEDMVIDQENVEAFQKKIEKCLSKMEKEVLALTPVSYTHLTYTGCHKITCHLLV